ncbi:MAG: MBL fold metallo-hydrolase [Sulfuricaulis sp.]|nr:MBL fold metallo-hydrolase [Sulfuricaulis sp.]
MLRSVTLVLVLSAVTSVALAHDSQAPSSIEHYPLDRVSQRIHVVHGTHQLPNPTNRGFMNNPAAILTKSGVIIVDPGSSAEIGKQLLKKIRKVSDKPVIAVFNTHVHGDHWLGNHGIRDLYPKVPIYAHERMIERVNTGEGENWLKLFMGMTKGAISGTKVVGPNIGLKGGETLTLDGVTLRIHHTGHAHTDGDLMIEVVDDKGLFFGDIANTKQVPNSVVPHDANFKGTIAAIKTMLNGPATLFIPGHGRSGGREMPEASLRFLEELYVSVTKYYKQGLADYEMKDKVIHDMAKYENWDNFNEMGRVISFVYREIEKENF